MPDVTADRHRFIGGSDARLIYQGNWIELYDSKVNQIEVDLSHVFQAQLGKFTEKFHLEWLIDKHGHELILPSDDQPLCYERDGYRRCHLDARHASKPQIVEVKHTNAFTDLEAQALQYMAQIQHNIYVAAADECLFSCIFGNQEPVTVRVGRNEAFIAELLDMEDRFWECVVNQRRPAEDLPSASAGAHSFVLDDMREVDMEKEGNNEWPILAEQYTANQEPAKAFDSAKAGLKDLVPSDVRLARGNGVQIKRDKRGSLRFSTYE